MMETNKKTQEKIQELQIIEQNLRGLIVQKQTFEMDLYETENAINEILSSKEDIYKMIGNIMIKTDKKKTAEDLKKKKDILSLRIKSINYEEKNLNSKVEEIKKELMEKIK
jgi:prefoldin beta subunit